MSVKWLELKQKEKYHETEWPVPWKRHWKLLWADSESSVNFCWTPQSCTVGFTLCQRKQLRVVWRSLEFNSVFVPLTLVILVVPGSLVGLLLARDDDQAGTLNSQLTYAIVSQDPLNSANVFSIDAASGRIQVLRPLQRRDQQTFNLNVRVNDAGNAQTVTFNTTLNRDWVFF